MRQGLYYIAGWVAFKLGKRCEFCREALVAPEPEDCLPHDYVDAINKGGLSHPTPLLWSIILTCEDIFQARGKELLLKCQVNKFVLHAVKKKCEFLKPFTSSCHDVIGKVAEKFLALRVHILAADASSGDVNRVLYSSASAFARTATQNCREENQKRLLASYSAAAQAVSVCYAPPVPMSGAQREEPTGSVIVSDSASACVDSRVLDLALI